MPATHNSSNTNIPSNRPQAGGDRDGDLDARRVAGRIIARAHEWQVPSAVGALRLWTRRCQGVESSSTSTSLPSATAAPYARAS